MSWTGLMTGANSKGPLPRLLCPDTPAGHQAAIDRVLAGGVAWVSSKDPVKARDAIIKLALEKTTVAIEAAPREDLAIGPGVLVRKFS